MNIFEKSCVMPIEAGRVFAYYERPGAFERLAPPWEDIQVLERSAGIQNGGRIKVRLKTGPFRQTFTAVHRDYIEGRQFVDTMESGPFARWEHTHRFLPGPDGGSSVLDHIEYQLPGGRVGNLLGRGYFGQEIERLFRFRHARMRNDLVRQTAFSASPKLRIAMTGSTGLIGSTLIPFLTTAGHSVQRLVRGNPGNAGDVDWNVESGAVDGERLAGADALIHLAGGISRCGGRRVIAGKFGKVACRQPKSYAGRWLRWNGRRAP